MYLKLTKFIQITVNSKKAKSCTELLVSRLKKVVSLQQFQYFGANKSLKLLSENQLML
jgi:hypothetical protein